MHQRSILAIRKPFQCIQRGVRVLLANQTTTSKTLSYTHGYTCFIVIRETLKQWDKDILDMQDMSTKFKQFSQLFSFFSVCVVYNLFNLAVDLCTHTQISSMFQNDRENIKIMGQSNMKNQIFSIINVSCRLLDIVNHVTNN